MSGDGAAIRGARFNPKSVPTLYPVSYTHLEHVDRGICHARLKVDQARDEGRAAPVCRVVGEQESWRDRAFAHELPETVLVNRGHHVVRSDAEGAHEG